MSKVSKSQYRSSCSVSVVLCLFAASSCILSMGASATETENVAWFPYVNTHYSTNPDYDGSSPWGGLNWHLLDKFDDPGTPNPVWNADSIFYNDTTHESWFAQGGGGKTWQIALHNTGQPLADGTEAKDFTLDGSTDRRIRINIYHRDGGDPIDSSEVWTGTTIPLINTNGGDDMVWDSSENCFYVTVMKNETVLLNCVGNPNGLFTIASNATGYKASIEIVQPQGYDFLATMRGQDEFQWRTSTGTTSSSFSDEKIIGVTFGYPAVYENIYESGANTVRLPFYREQYLPATSSTSANRNKPDWATICYVVNTTNASDTLTFRIYTLDGTLISQQTKTLSAYQRLEFSPSQFFPSNNFGAYGRGYVEVSGTRPAAVAIQLRFPKSTSFIGTTKNGTWVSDYTRINNAQAMSFFIN